MLRPSTSMPSREKGPLLRDPRVRSFALQGLLLSIIAITAIFLTHNTLVNLAKRGIATGFGYLEQRAGFGISQTLTGYAADSTYWDALMAGLANTLLVAGLAIVTCTIVGVLVGMARLSSNWLLARCAAIYVEAFRNIPMLLQLLFWSAVMLAGLPNLKESFSLWGLVYLNKKGLVLPWYEASASTWPLWLALALGILACIIVRNINQYRIKRGYSGWRLRWWVLSLLILPPMLTYLFGNLTLSISIPQLTAFSSRGGIHLIPELVALWLTLTLYSSASLAEAVRSGIASVSQGQREAAMTLCLPRRLTMRKVIMPQALRVIVPQMTGDYLNIVKNSSLGVAIGYPDLFSVYGITTLNQTGQALEVMATTMLIYLLLSLAISMVMNLINARTALKER